jgi:hypothetical protein
MKPGASVPVVNVTLRMQSVPWLDGFLRVLGRHAYEQAVSTPVAAGQWNGRGEDHEG